MTWKEFVAEVEKQIKEQGGDDPEIFYLDVGNWPENVSVQFTEDGLAIT